MRRLSGTETLTTAAPAEAVSGRQRRRRGPRLSSGHLLMVLAALLAMLLNFSLLRAGDDRVQVAVAASPVRAGDPVPASSLRFAPVAVGNDVLDTLVSSERARSLDGWVAAHDLAAGDLVGVADLRRPGAPARLRAMSIPIDAGHAVGGQLRPGDRIDVIEVGGGTARYILAGAEVVAVAGANTSGLAALEAFSVTVAIDDAQALTLAAAIRAETMEIVRSTGAPAAAATMTAAAEETP
jgi:Flp pilus assembly protein CpaB